MPSSSTQAVDNSSDKDAKPHALNDNLRDNTGIERFLADRHEYHPVYSKIQSPAEAEAAAEARMTAKLHTFEKQFGSSGKPPSN